MSNTKYINKGIIYNAFHSWLGTGLLTSTGAKWHKRRKMLTPTFHYNILQVFIEIFGKHCLKLTDKLKKECIKPKVDITSIMKETTLKVICETSMGINLDNKNKIQGNYYESVKNIGKLIVERVLSPWLYSDILYYMSPMHWRERKVVNSLHTFTNQIVRKRQDTFQNNDVADLESEGRKLKKNIAMLDLLLYARNMGQIDYEGIREEVDTFVFEGHDTTAAAMGFILMLLANHKDVQDKVIEELDEIFGDSKRSATYNDLQKMKYLERTIKECLRLYPSVPFILRNITEDVPLTNHVCPSGTEVFIHIYSIHRDPKYFTNPEKFDPDRFLPENSIGRHPYAYIPFSAGPRNCIGQKFAMLELKSIVSTVLRNFILEPVDSAKNLTWIVDLVLRVKEPIYVKFVQRI